MDYNKLILLEQHFLSNGFKSNEKNRKNRKRNELDNIRRLTEAVFVLPGTRPDLTQGGRGVGDCTRAKTSALLDNADRRITRYNMKYASLYQVS